MTAEVSILRYALLTKSATKTQLLFFSNKFVKGFLAITFLLLVIFLAETFRMCVNGFFIQPDTKFQFDPTKNENNFHRPPL